MPQAPPPQRNHSKEFNIKVKIMGIEGRAAAVISLKNKGKNWK